MGLVYLGVFPFLNVSAVIRRSRALRQIMEKTMDDGEWAVTYLSLWMSFMFVVHYMYFPSSKLTN